MLLKNIVGNENKKSNNDSERNKIKKTQKINKKIS